MRIAVLVLGLILGAIMFVQTFLVYSLSGIGNAEKMQGSGAVGLFMALLWLVAIALVFAVPILSAVVFVAAGILGFAFSSDFPDLAVWGAVSMVLAVFSLIAWFSKRREVKREAVRQENLAAPYANQVQQSPRDSLPASYVPEPGPASSTTCQSCGSLNSASAKFCADCGTSLTHAVSNQ
jgi:hypothetical protein